MPPEVVWYLAPIVLLAYVTEAMTGFGAVLVAVTLGAHFYPIHSLVPVLMPLNVTVTGYVAFRYRSHIRTDVLFKSIVPFMGLGVLIGLGVFPLIKNLGLNWLLGLFVVGFSIKGLTDIIRKVEGSNMPQWAAALWQVVAGIVQAVYATGGPPLVYSLSRLNLPKQAFRATLCTVWGTFNTFLTIAFIINGRADSTSLTLTGWLLLILPLGIFIGEKLHGRVNERGFKLTIYCLLLVSGAALLFK